MVGKGASEWAKNHGIEEVSTESLKTGKIHNFTDTPSKLLYD